MKYRNIHKLSLDLVADGLEVPEGPVVAEDGSLLFVEVLGKRVRKLHPDGSMAIVASIDGGPNGLALAGSGQAILCNNGGAFHCSKVDGRYVVNPVPAVHETGMLQNIDLASGAVSEVASMVGGRRLESPNDVVRDRVGGYWFTDFGSNTVLGRNFGSICYLSPDHKKVIRAREGLMAPNGIGLSGNGSILYVADTILGRLWAFDVESFGQLRPGPPFLPGRIVGSVDGGQRLDSLALEEGGNICVATIGDGGISVFDPDGEWVDLYQVPDRFVTNICFGDPDMRDAWITASGTGRIYRARWPRPGLKLNY